MCCDSPACQPWIAARNVMNLPRCLIGYAEISRRGGPLDEKPGAVSGAPRSDTKSNGEPLLLR
jgi:hypothetical protein